MGLYRIRANLFRLRDNETITCIFIDKYLGGGRSAVSLTLIFGLEVWSCVLFAGLFVWAVEAGGGSCINAVFVVLV